MSLTALTAEEREVVRRTLAATFVFFDWDFQTRLGVTPDTMQELLSAWPNVDDAEDASDGCLAINNALNDLLHGVGMDDDKAQKLVGVDRAGMLDIYKKWASARGWGETGFR